MDHIKKWFYEKIANKTIEALTKNGFKATYFETKEEAINHFIENAKNYESIGFGGSITVVKELKLVEEAKKLNKKVLNHGDPNLTPEERNQVRLAELTCDLFVTSTNALTIDGKLVNIDGTGNRVNAMAFGPKKTIIYTGINKVVENVDDGIKRIKNIASPMNAKRLNFNTPCAQTGFCADCNSPQRICRIITIIEKNPPLSDIEVVIIGESLGF